MAIVVLSVDQSVFYCGKENKISGKPVDMIKLIFLSHLISFASLAIRDPSSISHQKQSIDRWKVGQSNSTGSRLFILFLTVS